MDAFISFGLILVNIGVFILHLRLDAVLSKLDQISNLLLEELTYSQTPDIQGNKGNKPPDTTK